MISHKHFHPFFIMNFHIELLEKKDPTNQSWSSILLSQKIIDGRVISVNNDLFKANTTASNSFSVVA
jgi:hypothetical protein